MNVNFHLIGTVLYLLIKMKEKRTEGVKIMSNKPIIKETGFVTI